MKNRQFYLGGLGFYYRGLRKHWYFYLGTEKVFEACFLFDVGHIASLTILLYLGDFWVHHVVLKYHRSAFCETNVTQTLMKQLSRRCEREPTL